MVVMNQEPYVKEAPPTSWRGFRDLRSADS